MRYRETSIEVHIQTREPNAVLDSLLSMLAHFSREYAGRGEGYIKLEIYNNEIEESEKKDEP